MLGRRVLVLLTAIPLVAACAGSPSSTSSWADTTDKTIGQAVSSLGTAQVVLEAHRAHHVFRSYAVGTLSDAVDVADKEIAKYDEVQPPDAQHRLARRVVGDLHAAELLLVEIRATYDSPSISAGQVSDLLARIDAELDHLDQLTTTVDGATS